MCIVPVIIWEQCRCQYCGPANACRSSGCSGTWSEPMVLHGLCPSCWMSCLFIPEMQMTRAQMEPPMQMQYFSVEPEAFVEEMAPQQVCDSPPAHSDSFVPRMQAHYLSLEAKGFAAEMPVQQGYHYPVYPPMQIQYLPFVAAAPTPAMTAQPTSEYPVHLPPIPQQQLSCRVIHPFADYGNPCAHPDCQAAIPHVLDPQANTFDPDANPSSFQLERTRKVSDTESLRTYDSGFVSS